MATDAKKHTSIAAGEKPTRQALADSILSINDAVPVANATEQAQVAAALTTLGQSFATKPLLTMRADAPALHRLEYTYDTDGTPAFLPASGVLHFANTTDADSWAAANPGLLTAGDAAMIGAIRYTWNGTKWLPKIFGRVKRTNTAPTFGTGAWYDASVNANWSADKAQGLAAFSNGWTAPIAGRYRVSYELRASGAFAAAVSVNNATPSTAQVDLAQSAAVIQGAIAFVTVTGDLSLAANDVVRVLTLSSSGTLALDNNQRGYFSFEWIENV